MQVFETEHPGLGGLERCVRAEVVLLRAGRGPRGEELQDQAGASGQVGTGKASAAAQRHPSAKQRAGALVTLRLSHAQLPGNGAGVLLQLRYPIP